MGSIRRKSSWILRGLAKLRDAKFCAGDAMALPFAEDAFDAAVMPLVIFFIPEPAKGVAEMARVVCPGGTVAAYAWDIVGGGFPYETLWNEVRAMGVVVPQSPSPDASRIDVMRDLWSGAGLVEVEKCELIVRREFVDFEDYWATILGGPSVKGTIAKMSARDIAILKEKMRDRLPADTSAESHMMRGLIQ